MHEPERAAAPLALELRDLRKNFGAAEIIRGVTLAIPRGERHAIIGPNGAGKSTLFNLMSGRLRPSAGVIYPTLAMLEDEGLLTRIPGLGYYVTRTSEPESPAQPGT